MTKRLLAHLTDSQLLEKREQLKQERPDSDMGREIVSIQTGSLEAEIAYRKQCGSWSKGEAESQ